MKSRISNSLAGLLASGVVAAGGFAAAAPAARVLTDVQQHVDANGSVYYDGALCDHSKRYYCKARMLTDAQGRPRTIGPRAGAGPSGGLGATDLQKAYGLDVSRKPNATIAIVDMSAYPNAESDLAAYRSQYGLPPCTVASGCLTIVGVDGGAPPTGQDQGWQGEEALDLQMASAACPTCKLLLIEDDPQDQGNGLFTGIQQAAKMGATVCSNSWGGADSTSAAMMEDTMLQSASAKMGIFVASGDSGYNNAGQGPDMPSTSEYVIGVGGTSLQHSGSSWTETSWGSSTAQSNPSNGAAGSSCSTWIATPAFQANIKTGCKFRAASDVSSNADPGADGQGVAVITNGQWQGGVGGTSEASPFTAGIFALYGHGIIKPDFVYKNQQAFKDVTGGYNGTCGAPLCQAVAGWDGPTGLGSPIASALAAIPATDPGSAPPPDMAMPPDMASPPDLSTETGGNGGSGGTGGNGGNGNGTGGNGNNGNGGSSGCSIGGVASVSSLWGLGLLVLAVALVRRRRA